MSFSGETPSITKRRAIELLGLEEPGGRSEMLLSLTHLAAPG
ncbi:MAG TPA: hypothetical protein VEX38_01950 [Fimbriimonadaceae bacterium]|nr:hypothetical protein [Fimbriimonadaceae bacterium]